MAILRYGLRKDSFYYGPYKVNSLRDNTNFIATESFKNIKREFLKLKKSKGHILHVVGAPGTGKSANIFQGMVETGLNVYEISSSIPGFSAPGPEVFKSIVLNLQEDLGVETKEAAYKKLKEYDAVLFADQFHDTHLLDDEAIGFNLWNQNAGLRSLNFYFICIKEYIKYYSHFQDMNIVFQTAWRFNWKDQKYDLFTDFGYFSRLILIILKGLFQVVEISYTPTETIDIIKSHVRDVDPEKLEFAIHKYGCQPRIILEDLKIK